MKKIIFFVWIIVPSVFLFFIFSWLIISSLFAPKIKVKLCTNEEIIVEYPKEYYYDSLFYNKVAEAFIETKYSGELTYSFAGYSGGTHKLFGYEGDLTDSFPKIREIIRKRYPDGRKSHHEIYYINKVVYIRPRKIYNKSEYAVIFLYANDVKNITDLYPNYKIYENEIPKEKDSWIYKFENNWYICSPDHWIFKSK